MIFKELFKQDPANKYINLGAPEAEAEATPRSTVPLLDVYEDYHNLLPLLDREKFIVIGRKGSGKSAFAEYVRLRSASTPNLFCGFIRNSEIRLEQLIHSEAESRHAESLPTILEWLIYVRMLRLILENEAISGEKEVKLLAKFLRKNAGYVDLTAQDVREQIRTTGGEIATEQLRRFVAARLHRELEVRSERAPYYKILPSLRDALLSALRADNRQGNENSYVLFIDDLDVGFSNTGATHYRYLLDMVRVSRHVNNDVFALNNVSAKVILLMRDDLEAFLSSREVDSAKIFSSYGATINWYESTFNQGANDRSMNIRKFINRRICYAFDRAGLPVNSEDPWRSLVVDYIEDKDSFRFIMPNTMFRPRDLLLLFQPLQNGAFAFPLCEQEVRSLLANYVDELAKEIKNELSSFFTTEVVETIFLALEQLARRDHTYPEALGIVSDCCRIEDATSLLNHLFGRSVIGNVDERGWLYFKCREPINAAHPIVLREDWAIVVHYGIRRYVQRRYRA